MERFIFLIYRWLLAPTAYLAIFLLRPILRGKLREIADDRREPHWIFEKNPGSKILNPVWIHAASGEIEYARPLIRALKEKYPTLPIVVTYSSPSAKRILKKMEEIDAWGPSPWDLSFSCRRFLQRIQPRCVLFSRTDVWPEIATQLNNAKIPSFLFSATFSSRSSRLRGLSRGLTGWSLKQLNRLFVVSELDQQVLESCGLELPISISGDTRFDQVTYRLFHPQIVNLRLRPPESNQVLVAGSTWPEDEKILLNWLTNSKSESSGWRLLLAPHEVSRTRILELGNELTSRGISFDLYSNAESWTATVLVLDQIGILAELYSWGHAALVGGSFKNLVHSVMEPLAAGLPVAVGPHHQNNREALLFKNVFSDELPLVTEIQSDIDLSHWLKKVDSTGPHSKNIQNILKSHQGATDQLLVALQPYLSQ